MRVFRISAKHGTSRSNLYGLPLMLVSDTAWQPCSNTRSRDISRIAAAEPHGYVSPPASTWRGSDMKAPEGAEFRAARLFQEKNALARELATSSGTHYYY